MLGEFVKLFKLYYHKNIQFSKTIFNKNKFYKRIKTKYNNYFLLCLYIAITIQIYVCKYNIFSFVTFKKIKSQYNFLKVCLTIGSYKIAIKLLLYLSHMGQPL